MRLALALVLLLAAPAGAFNEPDGVRGFKWGTPIADVERQLKAEHEKRYKGNRDAGLGRAPSCVANLICFAEGDIGPVSVRFQFNFHEKRLVYAAILSSPTRHAELRAILIERYGLPTTQTRPEFVTKGGLRTTNEVLTWAGPTVYIETSQYGGSLDSSQTVIVLRSELARQAAERAKSIKKGKDDL